MRSSLLILIILSCALFACKATLPVTEVPVKTETTIRERLVPVIVSPDSAVLIALFECDSNYNVLLKEFVELKTKDMKSRLHFSDNRLNYNATTTSDTIFIKAKDSLIYKDVPIKVSVPVEVNKLTSWQHFQIWCGRILFVILGVGIIVKLIKWK